MLWLSILSVVTASANRVSGKAMVLAQRPAITRQRRMDLETDMVQNSRVKSNWLVGAIVAGALGMGGSALAQTGDQQFQGQLDDNSQRDGRPYEVRTIALEAGKRYAFSADSGDFDPELRLSFANAEDEEIAEDDDGGEGNGAYLEFVPQRSGPYRLRVVSVGESMGSYTLKVRELPPLPAAQQPKPVATSTIGFKHFSGALTQSDGEIRGRRVDDYLFRFEAGRQVMIFMDRESDNFDPVVEVHAGDDRYSTQPLARDDDGGEGVNAFLSFTPEESGDYLVRATSVDGERATGSYILRVGQQP